jgi:hypothetical protein
LILLVEPLEVADEVAEVVVVEVYLKVLVILLVD